MVELTIAIPIYNAELFLNDAINSVLRQTFRDFKLILINDGSTDKSMQIVYSYDDPRIIIVNDGENRGLPFRLNQIIDMTDTVYLARMDADDIMHPDRINKQMEIFRNNPSIDVLGSNAFSINANNKVTGIRFKYSDKKEIRKVQGFIHPSIMAKTSWFRDNKYDESALRIEDVELWYRSRNKSIFMITTIPLLFYREISGNYYKKYFSSNASKRYILKKYNNDIYWKLFFIGNLTKGFIYRVFSFFQIEQLLINRRNDLKFRSLIDYKEYIH